MLGETGKDREVALAEIAARQVQIDADEALIDELLEERLTVIKEGGERTAVRAA